MKRSRRRQSKSKSKAVVSEEVSSIEWENIVMTEQEEDLIYRMHRLVGDRYPPFITLAKMHAYNDSTIEKTVESLYQYFLCKLDRWKPSCGSGSGRGRIAKRLQMHLSSPSSSSLHETRELLATRILDSYEKVLAILSGWYPTGEPSPATGGPAGPSSFRCRSESPPSRGGGGGAGGPIRQGVTESSPQQHNNHQQQLTSQEETLENLVRGLRVITEDLDSQLQNHPPLPPPYNNLNLPPPSGTTLNFQGNTDHIGFQIAGSGHLSEIVSAAASSRTSTIRASASFDHSIDGFNPNNPFGGPGFFN
ncbi:hypothetical protein SAY87_008204 [Trapa incisa]|uniref:Uncharacterized protein n=1 Tax=Trapa incisa TaxID=236973 RepID=A0AAN7QFU4_9MYRT|nr:hypothetical protein SAY87_008204 [Trapa incisa]